LKLTLLAVFTLFVLGCSTASFGQTYEFGFLSYDQSTQYCDYELFEATAPYAAGYHVLTSCGLPYDGVTVGFKMSLPKPSGAPVYGAVYALADNVFDAEDIAYSGCQVDWVTATKAATKGNLKANKYSWSFYETCGGGYDYLGNFGFLTTTLGAAKSQAGTLKTSFGRAQSKMKNGGKIDKAGAQKANLKAISIR
jgi:hypothetical protein